MPRAKDEGNGMVMLTGNSHPDLAKLVCDRLGIELAHITVYKRSNTETAVDIAESVRGKHVFILQSSSKDVNNDLVDTLILIYACRTSSAKAITVIMPFLPYSKQCRMLRRSAITMKLVADMICKSGATRLVSLDLYKKEIQGFFGIPVDNLRASPFLLQYVRENIDYRNAVIVAKSPGVMHKASSYADRLRLAVAVIHGEDNKDRDDLNEDGRQSPPLLSPTYDCEEVMQEPSSNESKSESPKKKTGFFLPPKSPSPDIPLSVSPSSICPITRTRAVSSTILGHEREALAKLQRVRTVSQSNMNPTSSYELFPMQMAKEKPPLNVVGDVNGRICFLVDDIIDEVQPFIAAADILKRNGALQVYVLATHGLLSADAPELLEHSQIDQVIVTNTVPHELQKSKCDKIITVDISLMLCEAIRRIYHKESMGVLFKDVTIDD